MPLAAFLCMNVLAGFILNKFSPQFLPQVFMCAQRRMEADIRVPPQHRWTKGGIGC